MTAKRFEYKNHKVYDNLTGETHSSNMVSVNVLNELYEENNLLKDIINDIVVQLDANHTSHTYQMTIPINKVIYNELKRRLKGTSFNEELRRFLE
jgi:hypothetical protein